MQGFESPPGLRLEFLYERNEFRNPRVSPTAGNKLAMNEFFNIFSKIPVWVLLCLAAISVVTGDVLAKYWSTNTKSVFYFAGLIAYAFSGFFYIPTLLREGLVATSVIWSILSVIGFLVVGILLFKETLTPLQIVGVILGIIALVILTLGK